jgi:hypothetical protein
MQCLQPWVGGRQLTSLRLVNACTCTVVDKTMDSISQSSHTVISWSDGPPSFLEQAWCCFAYA